MLFVEKQCVQNLAGLAIIYTKNDTSMVISHHTVILKDLPLALRHRGKMHAMKILDGIFYSKPREGVTGVLLPSAQV